MKFYINVHSPALDSNPHKYIHTYIHTHRHRNLETYSHSYTQKRPSRHYHNSPLPLQTPTPSHTHTQPHTHTPQHTRRHYPPPPTHRTQVKYCYLRTQQQCKASLWPVRWG